MTFFRGNFGIVISNVKDDVIADQLDFSGLILKM